MCGVSALRALCLAGPIHPCMQEVVLIKQALSAVGSSSAVAGTAGTPAASQAAAAALAESKDAESKELQARLAGGCCGCVAVRHGKQAVRMIHACMHASRRMHLPRAAALPLPARSCTRQAKRLQLASMP